MNTKLEISTLLESQGWNLSSVDTNKAKYTKEDVKGHRLLHYFKHSLVYHASKRIFIQWFTVYKTTRKDIAHSKLMSFTSTERSLKGYHTSHSICD